MADSPSKTEQDWEKSSVENDGALESPIDREGGEPLAVDPRVRRKVDLHLIPLVAILYLCSFL